MPFTTVISQFFTFLLLSSHLLHATVCIIKNFLCHDIKQAMSYHIMEFYVTTCRMSRLSRHPYISVTEGSIKRSQQVRSLNHLLPGLKVDKKQVYINPTILFSRLIAIIQREEEISPYFDYELTVIPTSLFKDNTMRKTPKSQLATAVANNMQPCEHNVQATHVIDGGALIHKVKWPKKATYEDIAQQYVSYIRAKYGASGIVFDGYEQGPSIKDHEHQLRVARTCADIQAYGSS